jgi:gamma-glutamylcyclotransferase (GGCT)/AIG2-like uncharacterized protein YtfP
LNVRLFVYGTLAPGDEAWPVLEPWVVGEPFADAAVGCLYDTGRGYPAATFEHNGWSLVHGTVVTLDPARASVALDTLDGYEGDEYARISVRTESGVEAATYVWIASLTGCRLIPGGRWRDR